MAEPRPRAQRRRDTEQRLAADKDVWVATASGDGDPTSSRCASDWDGEALLVATPAKSPAGRNLAATRSARVGLGGTRDVSMIDGQVEVEVIAIGALPPERSERFVAHTGFDPRTLEGYSWVRIVARRIQARREANERRGRELMRDGRWLD